MNHDRPNNYFDWIEGEAREADREALADLYERFLPHEPEEVPMDPLKRTEKKRSAADRVQSVPQIHDRAREIVADGTLDIRLKTTWHPERDDDCKNGGWWVTLEVFVPDAEESE